MTIATSQRYKQHDEQCNIKLTVIFFYSVVPPDSRRGGEDGSHERSLEMRFLDGDAAGDYSDLCCCNGGNDDGDNPDYDGIDHHTTR